MRVAILADDLIWSTRLRDLVVAAGAEARPVRSADALLTALPDVDAVVVDLTARAYDGIAAIESARAARRVVLAVGQHDDIERRKRAREAGAVFAPYRRMNDDGLALMTTWLRESAIESPA